MDCSQIKGITESCYYGHQIQSIPTNTITIGITFALIIAIGVIMYFLVRKDLHNNKKVK